MRNSVWMEMCGADDLAVMPRTYAMYHTLYYMDMLNLVPFLMYP